MKTPREILLERHRDAETKLDAIREDVIATAIHPAVRSARQPFPIHAVLTLWRELVLPCRAIWAGVATVWIAIMALHLATGPSPKTSVHQMAASSPGLLMVLREQKEILTELLTPVTPSAVSPAPASRPPIPGPRGELRSAIRSA